MAGELVAQAAEEGGGEVVPVDSEHNAVLQCITGQEKALRRLILTASGGPFREWPAEQLANASVEDALRHPTWKMGNKISPMKRSRSLSILKVSFTRLPSSKTAASSPSWGSRPWSSRSSMR